MNGKDECRNIVELAKFLISHGNKLDQKELFESHRDCYQCRLKKPIDFEIINRNLILPSNIVLSPESDEILDESTWYLIVGSNAK